MYQPKYFPRGASGGVSEEPDIIVEAGTDYVPFIANNFVLTNMALAEQEPGNNPNRRMPYQGADKTEIRFFVGGPTPGTAASVIRLKYNNAGTFVTISGTDLSLFGFGAAVAPIDTGWLTLPVAARIDGTMAMFVEGGNAVLDPAISTCGFELR